MNAVTTMSDEALGEALATDGNSPFDAALADGRIDREFYDAASRVNWTTDKVVEFKRALIQAGCLPPDDPADTQLLAAWERWKAAARQIEAGDPDATEEEDAPLYAELHAAEELLCDLPAATKDGAAAKLRRAIDLETTAGWVDRAITAEDDLTLFARTEELGLPEQLMIGALAVLVRPALAASASTPDAKQQREHWDATVAKFDKAAAANRMPDQSDDESLALVEAEGVAGDAVLAIPALDLAGIVTKFRIAGTMYDGIPRDAHAAIMADANRLASTPAAVVAQDPHPRWLAERERALREANREGCPKDERDRLSGRSIELDKLIFDTPATTMDGVATKLLLVTHMEAQGQQPIEGVVAAIVREVQEMLAEAGHV